MAGNGPGGHEVGRISVRVTPNTSGFRNELLAKLEAIEKMAEVEVDVNPDTRGLRQKIQAATAGIKAEVDVDTKQGAFEKLRNKVRDFDAGSLVPNFGTGFNLPAYAVIFTAIAAAASPLVGLVTSSLLTLPGLIATVATPIGALMLGLDGLKAAASRLEEPFNALKESMSANVESQFGSVFDKIGETFPMLARALPSVTQGLADMANSALGFITSAPGMQRIEDTIGNIGTALSQASPGVGSFVDGLSSLAKTFSDKLPGLADWFNEAGKSFSTWIDKVTADGSLSNAFDGLGKVLRTVFDVLGDLAEKGFEFMSNPENVQTFVTTLQFVGALLSGIMTISNGIWSALTSVRQQLEAMTTNAIGFLRTLPMTATAAWEGLKAGAANAVLGIVETFRNVGAALQGAWSGLQGIASATWEGVVSAVKTKLAEIVAGVATTAGEIVAEVSSWPGRIIAAIGNIGAQLFQKGVEAAQGFVNGLKSIPIVGPAISIGSSLLSGVANSLAIKSPSRKMMELGEYAAEGLEIGLTTGFQPVLDKAKSMAEQLSDAIASGLDVNPIVGGPKMENLDRMMDEIDLQYRSMKVELNGTEDKDAKKSLRERMSALQAQRDSLNLSKDQLDLADKYGAQAVEAEDYWRKSAESAVDAVSGFAQANGQQFLSDLNIGGGAITGLGNALLDYGLNAGKKYVFNVGNMDEALSAQKTLVRRESLQFIPRK